jgi:hypothetical protein
LDIVELINKAEPTISAKVKGFEGALGSLDALLTNFGDYSITLSCIALMNPEIDFIEGTPFAKFAGSEQNIAIDCFHVDDLHHNSAYGKTPEVLEAIGCGLAIAWSNILMVNNQAGSFTYVTTNGHDIEYRI